MAALLEAVATGNFQEVEHFLTIGVDCDDNTDVYEIFFPPWPED